MAKGPLKILSGSSRFNTSLQSATKTTNHPHFSSGNRITHRPFLQHCVELTHTVIKLHIFQETACFVDSSTESAFHPHTSPLIGTIWRRNDPDLVFDGVTVN